MVDSFSTKKPEASSVEREGCEGSGNLRSECSRAIILGQSRILRIYRVPARTVRNERRRGIDSKVLPHSGAQRRGVREGPKGRRTSRDSFSTSQANSRHRMTLGWKSFLDF